MKKLFIGMSKTTDTLAADFNSFVKNIAEGYRTDWFETKNKSFRSAKILVHGEPSYINKREITVALEPLSGAVSVTFKFPVNGQVALWMLRGGSHYAYTTFTFNEVSDITEAELKVLVNKYFEEDIQSVLSVLTFEKALA